MSKRILILRALIAVCFIALATRLWRLGWQDAYEMTLKTCRQRLAVETGTGWSRGDFYDREGLPLTNRLEGGAHGRPSSDRYGERPLAVHLLGYVNPGDGRGASGLEEACDDLLAQGPGRAVATVVDGHQRPIPGLGVRVVRPPSDAPGNVRLTIHRGLQAKVDEIADRTLPKGAIVVMSPWTGEILALASRPAFDPNHPAAGLGAAGAPFINRALAAYQPGSVFKLVVLAAALEEDPEAFWQIYRDPGRLELGMLRFSCPGQGHGEVTLADALAFSCNTTFIRLGLALGAKKLVRMAERLGFGLPVLQDLSGEHPGELPPAYGQTPGDVANASIGQGGVLATPVQIARLVSAIANGGFLVTGRVMLGMEDSGGRFQPFGESHAPVRVLSQETARRMRDMMAGVVRYGTGRAAAIPAGAGGKTGTAQTGRSDERGRRLNHAWFAGFAPLKRPACVAVVFAEEGGSGAQVAAPIFNQVMAAALACMEGRTGT